jgi:transposase-like protein
VSEITDRLWEDYQEFISRDLSGVEVEYLFVDAVFEALRRHGAKEALLVACCIASDGRKHLLHLAVGNKESQACPARMIFETTYPPVLAVVISVMVAKTSCRLGFIPLASVR